MSKKTMAECEQEFMRKSRTNKIEDIVQYETGAQRSADCEGFNYSLISPIALREIAFLAAYINWKDVSVERLLNASLICKYEFLSGEGITSIAQSAICLMAAVENEGKDISDEAYVDLMEIEPAPRERYDLIPYNGLKAVAVRYHFGAEKYGYYNWENGMDILSLQNHSIEHIRKYQNNDRTDNHLAAAIWGDFATIHSYFMWPELNKKLRAPDCNLSEGIKESWNGKE